MTIEPGKTYFDGNHTRHTIMGKAVRDRAFPGDPNTVYYDDIYWSSTENWYHVSGRFCMGPDPMPAATWRDLQEEAQ